MAKPNPSFQKRQRERQKKEKRDEKARRRAERQSSEKPSGGEILDGVDVTDPSEILGFGPEEDEPEEVDVETKR